MSFDLFGKEILNDPILNSPFDEPYVTALDTKSGKWQRRKKEWKALGIKSEVGRDGSMTHAMPTNSYDKNNMQEEYYAEDKQALNTSIFDPVLCELMYRWYCPKGGSILDPFAGGSVRGVVAEYLGYDYTGIELRPEQVNSNVEQALEILPSDKQPKWIQGDSNLVLNVLKEPFDFVFSCPPYADLEVYSDLPGDISNMSYFDFIEVYRSIIKKACERLKSGGYACFVVGEVRDKKGNYISFVPDTVDAFVDAGVNYFGEFILLNPIVSASMRAKRIFGSNKKLVKVHQNVLVFYKD